MKILFLILFCFSSITLLAGNNDIDKTKQAKEWLKNKPLAFIENKGQLTNTDGNPADNVLFKASYGDCDIYITTEGISYVFVKYDKVKGHRIDTNDIHSKFGQKEMENKTVSYYRLDMNLQGSSINKTQIIKELPGKQGVTNYFYPNCPDGIYGVQEYGKITIKNIYKGIDWVIYANAESREHPLKYDFLVHPQADYKDIKIKFVNAQSTLLTDNGTKLKIQTIAGNIEEGNLYSYLQNSSEKQAIKTSYTTNADSTLEFEIGAYDKTKTLVIDPLVWATYYDGDYENSFMSICTDGDDNIYITGPTVSRNFPAQQSTGAFFQATGGGAVDMFILKFNTQGVRQWATYYGGNDSEIGNCIIADSQDNIYIVGSTSSDNFPTHELTGAYFQANKAGNYQDDAFVVKFNKNGVRQWATYYGGKYGYNLAKSITADIHDNIYITGITTSIDFPTQSLPGAYNQIKFLYSEDIFILKFNLQGILQWATCYGGGSFEEVSTIRVDSQGNIYITGQTQSTDFPILQQAGAYNQASLGGGTGAINAFIVKFDKSGLRKWSTYYGGSSMDRGNSMCFDNQDNVYITGYAHSSDFPLQQLTGAYNQTHEGSFDAYILKFNNQGVRLWATCYGGNSNDQGNSICSDSQNNIYITGYTESADLPTQQLTGEYWQPTNAGKQDYFIAKFNKKGDRKWATYCGGENEDWGKDLAVDSQNSIYVIGYLSRGAYTIDYGNGAYYDNSPIYGILGGIFKITACNNTKPTSVQSDLNNICLNKTGIITLTAIGGAGEILKWYSDNLGLNYVGKGTPLIIPSPSQTTTYYARWESLCDTSECDSIKITIFPTGSLTIDPQICQGETFQIGNHNYMAAGIYSDTLATVNLCDSIITTNLTVIPTISTEQSPSICEGYHFQVGTNIYSTTGTYTDIFEAFSGCDSTVTTILTVNPLPVVSLGDDRLICPGDTIILTPGDGYTSYLWSDHTDLSQLIVIGPGNYSVTAYNDWCPASDEITINECGTEIWFPNAFSPDNNSINERFKPVILGILNTYKILIYNRWGQLLYESNDAYSGWDGTFQGSLCANGQYVYIVTYSMGAEAATQKQGVKRGSFTLLR